MESKTIFITGANKGIGYATAQLLLEYNHQLLLSSRSTDNLEMLAEEYPERVLVRQLDVRNLNQVKKVVADGKEKFGSIDVLVNNAGLGSFDFFQDARPEDWDKMIDVNIKGLLYAIHAVLPAMLEQGEGQIINLASVAGHHVFPRSAVYSATKHAVLAISEGLRIELADKIRTTIISPGAVHTNFADEMTNPEIRKEFGEYLSEGLDPQTIAQAIKQCIDYPPNINMTEMIIRPRKK